jgi:hypothetical protein
MNAASGIYINVDTRSSQSAPQHVDVVDDLRDEARRRLLDSISDELVEHGEIPSVGDRIQVVFAEAESREVAAR